MDEVFDDADEVVFVEGGGAVGGAEAQAAADGGECEDQGDQGAGGGDAEIVEDLWGFVAVDEGCAAAVGVVGWGGGLGIDPGAGHVDVGDAGDDGDGFVE